MAYRVVFVVGLLAVANGQEKDGQSAGNFAKFINSPQGVFSRGKISQNGMKGGATAQEPLLDDAETAMSATKTTQHTGAIGVFAGALAGASMLGVRVRRGASQVLRRDVTGVEMQGSSKSGFKLDIPLLLYFFFWYLGNYYYNITNKTALKAAGGALGFPMVISCLQLGVGSLYSLFLWAAPDARKFPAVTPKDIFKLLPVAFCSAD